MTGDLSLDQKTNYAAMRAREQAAEEHFFDAAQPFFPLGFSVYWRNPGHWDISARKVPGQASAWRHAHPDGQTSAQDGGGERAFCIRGEPGKVYVRDERWDPHRPRPRTCPEFRSVMSATLQEPEHG